MNSKFKILLVVLVLAAIAFAVHKYLNDPFRILGKQTYGSMDKKYLQARAKAISKKDETFAVAGKMYATSTGKSI